MAILPGGGRVRRTWHNIVRYYTGPERSGVAIHPGGGCVLRKLTWADGPKTGLVRFKRKDRTKDEARLAKAREIEK